jgi:hypothetical protein
MGLFRIKTDEGIEISPLTWLLLMLGHRKTIGELMYRTYMARPELLEKLNEDMAHEEWRRWKVVRLVKRLYRYRVLQSKLLRLLRITDRELDSCSM